MEKLTIRQAQVMIIFIVLSFLAGMQFSEYRAINRAQELLRSDRLQYDSNDITYVAIGKKQIKK